MTNKTKSQPFHSVKEELNAATHPALAFNDQDFLLRDELRPLRLQLELLKPELILQDNNITQTIVFFGSARIPRPEDAEVKLAQARKELELDPDNTNLHRHVKSCQRVLENSQYIEEARKLAFIISDDKSNGYNIVCGGGPSFMEAASRGAYDAQRPSVALNVLLPHEQTPNPYVTPELTFQFHYFAIRKMHFLMRARALVAFPGGFGTLDEVFEALTLIQTQKIDRMPLILINEEFWRRIINFEGLVEEGTISEDDLNLFQYVETAEHAWEIIKEFYKA